MYYICKEFEFWLAQLGTQGVWDFDESSISDQTSERMSGKSRSDFVETEQPTAREWHTQ